jgi:hypothetical protein
MSECSTHDPPVGRRFMGFYDNNETSAYREHILEIFDDVLFVKYGFVVGIKRNSDS